MKKSILSLALVCGSLVLLVASATAANKQVVAGAGPSTTVAELFFAQFSQQPEAAGYAFIVPPMSTKHAGGIDNSNSFLFGRTGRPLNAAELAKGKKDLILAKVPIAFASGEDAQLATLSLDQLQKIFSGEITNWSAVGGPNINIVTVGREPSEALFMELQQEYPFFQTAQFDVIFKNDDEVVKFLQSPIGKYAIAFGAKPNFASVKTLTITGAGHAGSRLGLVYDAKNADDPIVQAAIRFAASASWRQSVIDAGLIPINTSGR